MNNFSDLGLLLQHYSKLPRHNKYESRSWINRQGRLFSDKLEHGVYYGIDFGYDSTGKFVIIVNPFADEYFSIKASPESSGKVPFLRIVNICESVFGCNKESWQKELSSETDEHGTIIFQEIK